MKKLFYKKKKIILNKMNINENDLKQIKRAIHKTLQDLPPPPTFSKKANRYY